MICQLYFIEQITEIKPSRIWTKVNLNFPTMDGGWIQFADNWAECCQHYYLMNNRVETIAIGNIVIHCLFLSLASYLL